MRGDRQKNGFHIFCYIYGNRCCIMNEKDMLDIINAEYEDFQMVLAEKELKLRLLVNFTNCQDQLDRVIGQLEGLNCINLIGDGLPN